ncbi:MAG: hypothetical protein ACMXX9_01590 [Candidatus Woesearchaeota archaeon]
MELVDIKKLIEENAKDKGIEVSFLKYLTDAKKYAEQLITLRQILTKTYDTPKFYDNVSLFENGILLLESTVKNGCDLAEEWGSRTFDRKKLELFSASTDDFVLHLKYSFGGNGKVLERKYKECFGQNSISVSLAKDIYNALTAKRN